MRRPTIAALTAVALAGTPLVRPAAAQATAATDPVPQLVASGRGEVKVTPDRALLSLTVEIRRSTAAAAAQENARIQRQVFDTLRALGLPTTDLSTTDYSVAPEQRWNQQKQQAELIGYVVHNTLRVRIANLDLVGKVIDASLAKGANQVAGLEFSASNTEAARRQALAAAVEQAKGDAEVMAKAAGGAVAGLLEVAQGELEAPPPMPVRTMAMAAKGAMEVQETPINAGPQTLVVRVTTRWRFAPTAR